MVHMSLQFRVLDPNEYEHQLNFKALRVLKWLNRVGKCDFIIKKEITGRDLYIFCIKKEYNELFTDTNGKPEYFIIDVEKTGALVALLKAQRGGAFGIRERRTVYFVINMFVDCLGSGDTMRAEVDSELILFYMPPPDDEGGGHHEDILKKLRSANKDYRVNKVTSLSPLIDFLLIQDVLSTSNTFRFVLQQVTQIPVESGMLFRTAAESTSIENLQMETVSDLLANFDTLILNLGKFCVNYKVTPILKKDRGDDGGADGDGDSGGEPGEDGDSSSFNGEGLDETGLELDGNEGRRGAGGSTRRGPDFYS